MRVRRALKAGVQRLRLRRRLLIVGDSAGWIIDDVAANLAESLPREVRPKIVRPDEYSAARASTLHFIGRHWAWSDTALDGVHASNRLIGIWWHGRLDTPEPEMRATIERARRVRDRFWRMQVTCSGGRETMLEIGVPEERLVLLPMGIDLRRFRPPASAQARLAVRRRLGLPEDAVVVGCFQKDGQGWGDGMEPKWVKAPDVLADTLARLRGMHPIVALIPGPARGYLEGRLSAAGVPFRRPGHVPTEDLPGLYHSLDVYISPSRDEGGPAGVLESMASGVPVVSTRTGMPADLIDSGRNGFLTDIDDSAGLAACAAELIEKHEFRRRVAEAGLATIAGYDWRVLGPRYVESLYRPRADGR